MKYFSLGSWMDDFYGKGVELDIDKRMDFIRSSLSSFYEFEIEDDAIDEFIKLGRDASIEKIMDYVIDKIDIRKFLFDSMSNSMEVLSSDKLDTVVNEDIKVRYNAFLKEIMSDAIIGTYVRERSKREKEYLKASEAFRLVESFENEDTEANPEKTKNEQFFSEKTNYTYFYTFLGQMLGIKVRRSQADTSKSRKNKITGYRIPKYQSQLIANIIDTIKLGGFNKEHTLDKSKRNNSRRYNTSCIPTNNYIKRLLYKLDSPKIEVAERKVSLYIIEKIFQFNLIGSITDGLNKQEHELISSGTIYSTEKHIKTKNVANEKTTEKKITIEKVSYSQKRHTSSALPLRIATLEDLYTNDTVFENMYKLLFKLTSTPIKTKYLHAIWEYRETFINKIVVANDFGLLDMQEIENELFSEKNEINHSWLKHCTDFLRYLHYYFIPLVENVFYYFFLQLEKTLDNQDVIERLLISCIEDMRFYPSEVDEYKKAIYFSTSPDTDKKKKSDYKKPKLSSDCLRKSENIYKSIQSLYDINIGTNLDIVIKKTFYHQMAAKTGVNAVVEPAPDLSELNTMETSDTHDMSSESKETSHEMEVLSVEILKKSDLEEMNKKLIHEKISNLTQERSLFKKYSDIKYIYGNCNGFEVLEIFRCLMDAYS